jgi:hypothetical protein
MLNDASKRMINLMSKLIFFIFFVPLISFSQGNYFEKVYGTAGNDFSRSVKQLNSGSIYVIGNSDSGTIGAGDISLTKLDSHGNELWTNYYGTANTENAFYLNTTTDGNLVFAAETETASNNLDVLIYKTDTSGNIIWDKSYATPVNETVKYIEQTDDGGYILCGAQNDSWGFYDILVLKLDAAGDYEWHQTLGRNDNEYSDMIHQINGGYILTGDTKSYGAGGYDVILYDLDPSGIEIWSQTYGDSLQNGCQGLLMTSDNKYLSYGETELFPFSAFDFYLEKIDTSGNSIWRYTYGGIYADAIFSVQEDSDGGFICTGYSNSYNGGGPLDLVILKVDQAGGFLWKQTYGGTGIDIGYELIRSVDNNGFIITGKTYTTSNDYYLLKLDNAGLLSGITHPGEKKFVINIFPDPAADEIFVSYDAKNCRTIEVNFYDILGKNVKKEIFQNNSNELRIDISTLEQGIYFCDLILDGKFGGSQKFVIEK